MEKNPSLDEAKQIKIRESVRGRSENVKIFGWVHHITRQGKSSMFVVLRDGTGFLRCVMTDVQCQTSEALSLAPESAICIYGVIKQLPKGKTAYDGHELSVSYWELIGAAPAGGAEQLLNEKTHVDVQLDNRHMMIRREDTAKILKLRSVVTRAFREHYFHEGYFEITPPTIMQTPIEPGSNPFKLDYFGEETLLTTSSQLYLETALPALGDVFCIAESFRAEPSATRRHLAEFTHVEAECPFITFDELLHKVEFLICDVVDRVLKSPYGSLVYDFNPNFKPPKRPFKRMDYSEAIKYLKEHEIKKEDGGYYKFGEDIPETPERRMTDEINEPIMLCRFPAEIRNFHTQKCEEDERLAQSVNVLLPGVGEVVDGAMRIWDSDELLEEYERDQIDPTSYYWYTDQRKFGSCPHGGYGLGLERFLTWLLNRHHICDVCLYPRFVGRCKP